MRLIVFVVFIQTTLCPQQTTIFCASLNTESDLIGSTLSTSLLRLLRIPMSSHGFHWLQRNVLGFLISTGR